MELKEMIYRRRSCRRFTDTPVDEATLQKIRSFQMTPLYPQISVDWQIVGREAVSCICPWTTRQVICIYSAKEDGYLENVGFLFQQLDLYMQSIGLGVCWLGMGRTQQKQKDGMDFVMMMAFGHPKETTAAEPRRDFKRKRLEQIADREDAKLEAARLAPSSVNSQPWYFVHTESAIHTFCTNRRGVRALGDMNRIDIGIALAHLFVENRDSFRFFSLQARPTLQGHSYIGSFEL